MGISILSHYLRAIRARLLYEPIGYKVSNANSFYAVLIGYMMNYIIPRAGEVSRCAVLTKTNNMPLEKSVGTVVTERLVDLILLFLILILVFALRFDLLYTYLTDNFGNHINSNPTLKITLIAIFIASFAFVWFKRHSLASKPVFIKLVNFLRGFTEGLLSIKRVNQPVLFVALSLGIWVCYILMMYLCLFSLESTSLLTFTDCLVVFAMGTIGVVIPAPGAGAGTYHFAVMQSLLWFGVPKTDGIAYATIVHGVQMILLISLGLLSSLALFLNQKKKA